MRNGTGAAQQVNPLLGFEGDPRSLASRKDSQAAGARNCLSGNRYVS